MPAGLRPLCEAEVVTNKRGSVEQGLAAADIVLEETYENAVAIHSPMEAHGSVAQWDGDRLTVWDTSQGVIPGCKSNRDWDEHTASNVQGVIGKYMAAASAANWNRANRSVIAALLAKKAARPVRLFLPGKRRF